MKRKIIKLGPATRVVSLPTAWLKDVKVDAGDEVEVQTEANELVIKATQHSLPRITLKASVHERMLARFIGARYMQGYDEIEVVLDTPEANRKVQKKVKNLIGMEIVEQSKERLLIKDIGGDKHDEFQTVFGRIIHLMQSISDEVTNAVTKNEKDTEYLDDMEKTVNRFSDYAFRLLNKYGYQERNKTATMFSIIFQLEELADDYKDMLHLAPCSKETAKFISRINKHQELLTKLLLNYTEQKVLSMSKERDSIYNDIQKALEKTKKPTDARILHQYLTILEHAMMVMDQAMLLY